MTVVLTGCKVVILNWRQEQTCAVEALVEPRALHSPGSLRGQAQRGPPRALSLVMMGQAERSPVQAPPLRALRACPPQRLPPPCAAFPPDPRPSPARLPMSLLESQSKVQASGQLSGQGRGGGLGESWTLGPPITLDEGWGAEWRAGRRRRHMLESPGGPRLERGRPKVTEKHVE